MNEACVQFKLHILNVSLLNPWKHMVANCCHDVCHMIRRNHEATKSAVLGQSQNFTLTW